MKHCKPCGDNKKLCAFGKDKYTKDGLYHICRNCRGKEVSIRYKLNPERHKRRANEWNKANPGAGARRYKENPDKFKAKQRKRVDTLRRATPQRVDRSDHRRVINFLKGLAEKCTRIIKKQYCVDHIIPLDHKDVSGLNVPWDMQVISLVENSIKAKKFDGTYQNRFGEDRDGYT